MDSGDSTAVKGNLEVTGGSEARLESLPDLLLGVELLLGLAIVPALEADALTGRGIGGRVDQLDGAGVRVLALSDAGRRGENHGAGLDATHGHGLQVAH